MGRPPKTVTARRTIVRGPWMDVGPGHCQKCGDERRLYTPLEQPHVQVCATCSQPQAFSGLPNTDHDDRLPTADKAPDQASDPIEEPEPKLFHH